MPAQAEVSFRQHWHAIQLRGWKAEGGCRVGALRGTWICRKILGHHHSQEIVGDPWALQAVIYLGSWFVSNPHSVLVGSQFLQSHPRTERQSIAVRQGAIMSSPWGELDAGEMLGTKAQHLGTIP